MSATANTTMFRLLIPASITAILIIAGLGIGFMSALYPPGLAMATTALPALLLLWVLPELKAVPKVWAKFLLEPYIFSILCIPVYYAIILPGVPWISFRRAILYPFIMMICVTLAGSRTTRVLVWNSFAQSSKITFCFLGFLATMLISTVLSSSPFLTINSDVFFATSCFLPMLGGIILIQDQRSLMRLFTLMVACVGINLAIGFVEHILQRPFLIYALPAYMREQLIASNPLAVISYITGQGLRGGMYRSASTFSNSLTWGEASAMLAPMCLHFLAHGRSQTSRLYGLVGVLMCLLSVFLSGSRGAYVGMIFAVVLYSIAWALRTCRHNPANLVGKIWLFLYMLGAGVTGLAVLFVPRIHNLVLGGGDADNSNQGRYMEWDLAKPKILSRPLWGYGGGTASDVIHYTGYGGPGAPTSVDSYLMNLLVDYGVPGFFFFFALFGLSAISCIRTYYTSSSQESTWGAAIGTSIIAFLVYRITLSQVDSLALAFFLIGLTIVYRRLMANRVG